MALVKEPTLTPTERRLSRTFKKNDSINRDALSALLRHPGEEAAFQASLGYRFDAVKTPPSPSPHSRASIHADAPPFSPVATTAASSQQTSEQKCVSVPLPGSVQATMPPVAHSSSSSSSPSLQKPPAPFLPVIGVISATPVNSMKLVVPLEKPLTSQLQPTTAISPGDESQQLRMSAPELTGAVIPLNAPPAIMAHATRLPRKNPSPQQRGRSGTFHFVNLPVPESSATLLPVAQGLQSAATARSSSRTSLPPRVTDAAVIPRERRKRSDMAEVMELLSPGRGASKVASPRPMTSHSAASVSSTSISMTTSGSTDTAALRAKEKERAERKEQKQERREQRRKRKEERRKRKQEQDVMQVETPVITVAAVASHVSGAEEREKEKTEKKAKKDKKKKKKDKKAKKRLKKEKKSTVDTVTVQHRDVAVAAESVQPNAPAANSKSTAAASPILAVPAPAAPAAQAAPACVPLPLSSPKVSAGSSRTVVSPKSVGKVTDSSSAPALSPKGGVVTASLRDSGRAGHFSSKHESAPRLSSPKQHEASQPRLALPGRDSNPRQEPGRVSNPKRDTRPVSPKSSLSSIAANSASPARATTSASAPLLTSPASPSLSPTGRLRRTPSDLSAKRRQRRKAQDAQRISGGPRRLASLSPPPVPSTHVRDPSSPTRAQSGHVISTQAREAMPGSAPKRAASTPVTTHKTRPDARPSPAKRANRMSITAPWDAFRAELEAEGLAPRRSAAAHSSNRPQSMVHVVPLKHDASHPAPRDRDKERARARAASPASPENRKSVHTLIDIAKLRITS